MEALHEELEALRADFTETLETLPDDLRQAFEGSIAEVYARMDGYAAALGAGEGVEPASDRLDEALFLFRQDALLCVGPTRVPGANLLLQTLQLREAGEPVDELWQSQLAHEIAAVQAMLPDHHAVREYLQVLLENPTAANIEQAAIAMEEALSQAGPTSWPVVNRVLNGCEPPEALLPVIAVLRERCEALLEQAETAPGLREQAQQVLEAAARLEAGDLIEATRQLDGVQAVLRELADHEGKVPCMQCNHYSRADLPTCQQCGARLPRVAQGATGCVDVCDSATA